MAVRVLVPRFAANTISSSIRSTVRRRFGEPLLRPQDVKGFRCRRKKRDWMRYALKGFSSIVGPSFNHGLYKVMPAVMKVMKTESTLVTLVKPQFEAHRSQVGGGGIVRDPQVHQEVRERIIKGVEGFGFCSKGWIESPIKGVEGNTEFLVSFQRTSEKASEL